jgi:hypothetical protein
LTTIFLRGADGRRPVFGGADHFQTDPHFRDHLLFYEYFHGDNGAELGASHQTGWTGLVGRLVQSLGAVNGRDILERGVYSALVYRPAGACGLKPAAQPGRGA